MTSPIEPGVPRPEIRMLLDTPAITMRQKDFDPRPVDPAAVIAGLRATPAPPPSAIPLAEISELTAGEGGSTVRVYRPAVEGPLPVLVYFHGGGWVFGTLDAHDAPCRALANAGRCLVVSVDYRLAPEHPFPGPLDDCYAVTRWVVDNAASLGGDPARVGVGGGSSGANLAAAVCLRARDDADGPRLVAQALFYPALDATTSQPSFTDNATGFNLSAAEMRFYWDCYHQQSVDLTEPLLSPLHAPDLAGLPPAIVHTAGLDVLRDEGEAYGDRLAEAGVPAVVRRYEGQIHGFVSMAAITPDAGHSLAEVGAWLDRTLRTP